MQNVRVPDWDISYTPTLYQDFMKRMDHHVELLIQNKGKSKVFLLEYEEVYTTGASDNRSVIGNIPLIQTNRGGAITYHGPGQRIIYPILNLNNYKLDLHWYLNTLEQWIIGALKNFDIEAEQNATQRGVWVKGAGKIASIGIRMRKWITLHGCAVNIETNMNKFQSIRPCGIDPYLMTSCSKLGKDVSIKEFDQVLQNSFDTYFCM
jgi:lipoyl(octanoyl) transferase